MSSKGKYALLTVAGMIVTAAALPVFFYPTCDYQRNPLIGLNTIEHALKLYKLRNGEYPATEQGLAILLQNATQEPDSFYLREIPFDPWGNPAIYRSPAKCKPDDKYDLYWPGPNAIDDCMTGDDMFIDADELTD